MDTSQHTEKNISTSISIQAGANIIWKHITRVQIAKFDHPWYFRLLDIPKPTHAEITRRGKHGRRIAYFANGKRFVQTILAWKEPQTYAFTFQPEPNFRVGWLFDLSDGPFQLVSGAYHLHTSDDAVKLQLETTYQISKRWKWILGIPMRQVLKLFQRYLLQSIKQIAESNGNPHPAIN